MLWGPWVRRGLTAGKVWTCVSLVFDTALVKGRLRCEVLGAYGTMITLAGARDYRA